MERFFVALSLVFLIWQPFPADARQLDDIVLDLGHGGFDFGLEAGGKREKDIALSIGKKLKSFLKDEGKRAHLTREVDRYLSFADRRLSIDEKYPDALLSIHLSASDSAVVYVTFYKDTEADLSLQEYYSLDSRQRRYLYESRVLASTIGDAIGREFGINVYYGEMPLPILSATGAPAIMVELPSSGIKYDEETMQRFAYSIGIGLQLYGQQ